MQQYRIIVECNNCGKKKRIYPYEIKKKKHYFCDKECFDKWQSHKTEIKCEACKKSVTRSPSRLSRSKHSFCGNKCYNIWSMGKNHPFFHKTFSSEHIKKLRESHIGKPVSLETRRKLHDKNIGKILSKEHKIKIGIAHKGKIGWNKGKHHTERTKKRISEALKGDKHPQYRNSDNILKITKNIQKRPTKIETIFKGICEKNNIPFHYTGDGQLWIGTEKKLNPDFIEANGKKICVEIFGEYWHNRLINPGLTEDRTMPYRKEHYKIYGWKSIFLWETDLLRNDAEAFVLSELRKNGIKIDV